jgi:hypothetical protein
VKMAMSLVIAISMGTLSLVDVSAQAAGQQKTAREKAAAELICNNKKRMWIKEKKSLFNYDACVAKMTPEESHANFWGTGNLSAKGKRKREERQFRRKYRKANELRAEGMSEEQIRKYFQKTPSDEGAESPQ